MGKKLKLKKIRNFLNFNSVYIFESQESLYSQPRKVRVSILPKAYITPHSGLYILAIKVEITNIITPEIKISFIGKSLSLIHI